MRGRKIDTEFLTNFITSCIDIGKSSSEDILQEAKDKIEKIDKQIREIEKLKIIRSKLLDVILSFDKNPKPNQSENIKALTFFKIQNQHICKFICDRINSSAIKIESLHDNTYDVADILFSVKQLIEHRILSRVNDTLLKGELYDEYLKFVLGINNE